MAESIASKGTTRRTLLKMGAGAALTEVARRLLPQSPEPPVPPAPKTPEPVPPTPTPQRPLEVRPTPTPINEWERTRELKNNWWILKEGEIQGKKEAIDGQFDIATIVFDYKNTVSNPESLKGSTRLHRIETPGGPMYQLDMDITLLQHKPFTNLGVNLFEVKYKSDGTFLGSRNSGGLNLETREIARILDASYRTTGKKQFSFFFYPDSTKVPWSENYRLNNVFKVRNEHPLFGDRSNGTDMMITLENRSNLKITEEKVQTKG